MRNTVSPLRYPGGKAKLEAVLKKYVFASNCTTLVEPFCGGAGVGLELLMEGTINEFHLNDLDKGVYCFWKCVLEHTEELIEMIEQSEISVKNWEVQKGILKQNSGTELELGFATLYCNRCNRSGILNAGCIGGKKQDGQYKIGNRFNKEKIIKKIRKIAEYKEKIHLYNMDVFSFLDKYSSSFGGETILYFDPPYVKKGKELYRKWFEMSDHIHLRLVLGKLKKVKWILTYDDTKFIRDLYEDSKKFNLTEIELPYSAGVKRTEKELLISSFDPETEIRKKENLKDLDDMVGFETDWDGYGSKGFSPELIAKCKKIIKDLKEQPEVFPTGRKSVQMQYKFDDHTYLEFEIYEDKIVSLYVPKLNYTKAEEKELYNVDDSVLNKIISDVFSKHSKNCTKRANEI